MPIQECTKDGKPGYQYGDEGFCYTYTAGNETSQVEAKRKAIMQGVAIERERGGEVHE
jgi:hypothetical protein